MSTEVRWRRGTAAQNDAFTGAPAEVTVDTTNKTLRVHDGSTPGGSSLAVAGGGLTVLDSIAELKAVPSGKRSLAFLQQAGREGHWLWDATIPIATHQGDPREQRYIAPDSGADGAWVKAGSVQTGGRWTTDGNPVRTYHLGGRVFVGASTENDGAAGVGRLHSWLDDDDYVGMSAGGATLEQNAQFAAVSNAGLGSVLGASRTSDFPALTGGTLAVTGWAFADSAEHASGAWAGYFIGVRKNNTEGSLIAAEIGTWIQDTDAPIISPYNMYPSGAAYGLHVANGIPVAHGASALSYSASAAISIINNHEASGKFRAGIVFKDGALDQNPNDGGSHAAVSLPKNYAVQWYTPGNLGPQIMSTAEYASGEDAQRLVFNDHGLTVEDYARRPSFRVENVVNVRNYVNVRPAGLGGSVEIAAQGDDTNIDLVLSGKGSAGRLNLAGPAVTGSAGAGAGYATIKYNGTEFKVLLHNPA